MEASMTSSQLGKLGICGSGLWRVFLAASCSLLSGVASKNCPVIFLMSLLVVDHPVITGWGRWGQGQDRWGDVSWGRQGGVFGLVCGREHHVWGRAGRDVLWRFLWVCRLEAPRLSPRLSGSSCLCRPPRVWMLAASVVLLGDLLGLLLPAVPGVLLESAALVGQLGSCGLGLWRVFIAASCSLAVSAAPLGCP